MLRWDRAVSGIWGICQYVLLPLLAGLDVRFAWTPDPGLAARLVGAVAFAGGLGLFGWAMVTNAYFSTVVRVQAERGHTVCRSGPYRFVRHPGYLGAMLQSAGAPILLGSAAALAPGLAAVAAMAVRTALEDRLLCRELPGYAEYAGDVRSRLVPHLW